MLLGAHESIAGGVWRCFERGAENGDECLQIFSKNQQQWQAKPLTDEDAAAFREHGRTHDFPLDRVLVHASYLINLGSPDEEKRKKSIEGFLEEITRCERLGLTLLNLHPGSHSGEGEREGLRRIIESFDEICARSQRSPVKIVLENTAGQGSSLGYRFEHLAEILDGVADPARFAVCLDTAHTFAAGYDLSTERGYAQVMDELDALVGLDRLVAFHLNDSKKPLGSRVDRHAEIGKGYIGETCFACLVRDERHAGKIGVLELPPGVVPANLARLRALAGGEKPRRRVTSAEKEKPVAKKTAAKQRTAAAKATPKKAASRKTKKPAAKKAKKSPANPAKKKAASPKRRKRVRPTPVRSERTPRSAPARGESGE